MKSYKCFSLSLRYSQIILPLGSYFLMIEFRTKPYMFRISWNKFGKPTYKYFIYKPIKQLLLLGCKPEDLVTFTAVYGGNK